MPDSYVHPSFTRAAALSEPLRSHFPKSSAEAQAFEPIIVSRALSAMVLVVARTRVECAWTAYVDAVPGRNHTQEQDAVLAYGAQLDEALARVLFPFFQDVPYAS